MWSDNLISYTYLGGDCCLTFIKVDFCETCICHEDGKRHLEYGETTTEYIQCPDLSYVGDGLCDDLTNIVQCSYDGGDCCLDDKKTFYCKDCKCQNETTSSEISGLTWHLFDTQSILFLIIFFLQALHNLFQFAQHVTQILVPC